MSCRSVLRVALVLWVIGWQSNSAQAQTAPSNDGRAQSGGLAEVVVTANKRAESIQDVPASVMAVTSETLERANVRTFDDLENVVPALTISKTTQPANNSINIRGIGTYAYSIATQPATVVVVDDVPQAFQAQAFTSLADVQQVEVLRGPQSTLFGKSSTAGSCPYPPVTRPFTQAISRTRASRRRHCLGRQRTRSLTVCPSWEAFACITSR
jgi:iron complex outermembrane receptor protein